MLMYVSINLCIYLFYPVVLDLVIKSSFMLFLMPMPFWHICILFKALLNFLALQYAPVSSCVFSDVALESKRYLQGALTLIYWRMAVRNQDLSTRCAHCCCSAIAPKSSQQMEPANMWMNINSFTHMHLCLFR